ncbi:MAG: zinc-dependent metalloprotease [Candidatus Scalindua sp.]|nr:zinc-dependent metalloprotease [Candidatus Scalindua sp.]
MNSINEYNKNLRFLWVLFFIFLLGITTAFAFESDKELFTEALQSSDTYATREKAEQDPTIVRSRYVNVNFTLLAEEKDVASKSQGDDSLIVLNLFDEVAVTAINERVERRSSSSYTWIGWIPEREVGQAVLAVEGGHMAGNITIGGKMYQVRSIGNGVHAIYEIDQGAFSDEHPPIPVEGLDDSHEADQSSQEDSASTIDIMVVYTDDARAAAGGTSSINAQIHLAISETNQSYANSGIFQRVRLVHAQEVFYAETGDMYTDLDRITSAGDSWLDQIHTWRNTYCADMVSFWVENGGSYCGLAWLMVDVSNNFESAAFSVVDRGCATGNFVFGHELGHNMGAHHDRANANGYGAYSYSFGYQDPGRNWRTIMAYNCPGGCIRVNNWSNPDVLRNGIPMGVPSGQSDSADNRKALNNTAFTVANFRQACGGGSTPEITSPVPGSILNCGDLFFNWSANGTAVSEWQLYVGTMQGGRDILDSGNLGSITSLTVSGIPEDGSTVHVRLRYNSGGTWRFVDYQYTAASNCGGTPSMTSPASGSTLNCTSHQFSWTNPNGSTAFWVYAGSSRGAYDYYNSRNIGTATSHAVTGLPSDGSTVYVRLYYYKNGWKKEDYTYKACTGGGGGTAPSVTSPASGSTLNCTSHQFSWTNPDGSTAFWVYAGSSRGAYDHYNSRNIGTVTSHTVTGLPSDGSTVYVRLYYYKNGWKKEDYIYKACTDGGGGTTPSVTSPASGSTLNCTSHQFSWTNPDGSTAFWMYAGSSRGAYDYYNSRNIGTVTSHTVTGLPSDGSIVYIRLYSYKNGWKKEDYTYKACTGG